MTIGIDGRLVVIMAAVSGCSAGHEGSHGGHGPGMHHRFTDAGHWAQTFDDPARDAWQRPDDVLAALELTPTSTVADIGAGTGYFTMRLARALPRGKVIATDVEMDMVSYLEERAAKEQLDNVLVLHVTPGNRSFGNQSVDRVLVVHVWHHLNDRAAEAKALADALTTGGKLVIVEFDLTAERGPPKEHRLAPETIIAELAAAGLSAKLSPTTLPDQYLIEARKP